MKRDMELIRLLLLKVEELPIQAGAVVGIDWGSEFFDIPGYDRDTAIKHFQLLLEAGFLSVPKSQGMTLFMIKGLSWEGHEFIDSIRSPEVWSKTKGVMKSVGGFGLDVMVQVAKAEGKRLITEKLGIPL
ncbi:MAG: DUF2513 domain-containing protein [Stellaceae bacterium]